MTPEMQAALDEYLAATQGYAGQTYGELTPAEIQETALAGVQYDPRMLEYEMSALRALEEQGREGLTAQDKAAIAAAERQAGQAARGRRGAIEQGMRSRGISGSGLDLVAQLQSAESANELAAMKALEQGALSSQRRTQGQLQAGQMAGQIGTRQYQTAAEKAAAQDRIRQFNAQNRMGAQQFNIQSAQQQAANKLAAQQSAAQMKYNAGAESERARLMREEERRRRRQGGLAAGLGVLGAGLGAYASGGSPQGAAAGYTVGSGLGTAFGGYADGGRVSPYNLNLPGPTDIVPAMLTPGEIVLPTSVANSPDAAAEFVAAQNKAEQDIAEAKKMRDIYGYADVAAKALSDYSSSQAPTRFLPRRMEDLGKGPEMYRAETPQYQAGSLAQLGEAGVKRAQEGLGAAKEKFATSVGLESYKQKREYDDPTSQISKRANLLLKSQLNALSKKAIQAGDAKGARELMQYSAGPDVSANQAMQTLQMVKSIGDEYGDVLNYLAQQQKLNFERGEKARKESLEAGEKTAKKVEEQEKLRVGDYGYAFTEDEAKKLRTAMETKDNLNRKLDAMIKLREKFGGEAYNRDAVATGQQLAKEAQLLYKDLKTLGALTGPDLAIIESIIPTDPLAFDIFDNPTMKKLENAKKQSDLEFKSALENKLKLKQTGTVENLGKKDLIVIDNIDDL